MNIFFLFSCPHASARAQCNKHVVKMVLEGTQLLYTAHHLCGDVGAWNASGLKIYKATHINHPIATWVRSAAAHYRWLHFHVCALSDEYTLRFGRVHECARHLARLRPLPARIPSYAEWTTLATLPRLATVDPPDGCIAAPACIEETARDECIVYRHGHIDLVESYRRYYEWKRRIGRVDMRWSRRPIRRRWMRALLWVCLIQWVRRRSMRHSTNQRSVDSKRRRIETSHIVRAACRVHDSTSTP